MKVIHFLAGLSLSVLLSACATFQGAGDIAQGREAMFAGDYSRKATLVEHGFRLPSALDNRPLRFDEWEQRIHQVMFMSATPGPYELEVCGGEVVEQVIRPTGLMDPVTEVRPVSGQVDDLLVEIRDRASKNERVLCTTLTKRMAEGVNDAFLNLSYNYKYDDPKDPERFFYRSDHIHYARKGIPIIFFFTGVHPEYHTPADTWDKVNAEGEVIEGDPKKVREVTDIWTFAREVASRNPNWKLVATEAAN